MRRFYKEVAVSSASAIDGEAGGPGAGWLVLLDGKPLKTPRGAVLALPNNHLAVHIAAEWRDQGEEIKPLTMLFTKLANTAIDRVQGRTGEVSEMILAYINDALCYRAARPQELVARQNAGWNPLLEWAAERFGARLKVGTGVAHVSQPEESLAALDSALSAYDPFTLTAIHSAATITGSLVLALAMAEGRLDPYQAFMLSQLDERYQAENWGEDAEAAARSRALAAELSAAGLFMKLARG